MTAKAAAVDGRPVFVRWRLLDLPRAEQVQAAREIAQTLLAERQRRVDAPTLVGVRAAAARTAQTARPLNFTLDDEKVVAVEWADPQGRTLRVLTDRGRNVEVKTHARPNARATFVDVENPKPRRRPARVMVRPGSRRRSSKFDPTLGLEELIGGVVWQPGTGGAWVAVVERDPAGNAVGCGRLSGEDKNETMATQVEGLLALEERHEELLYRYLVLAVDMSGTRPVRYDPHVPPTNGPHERDDMVIVDRFIQQGWLEHIAWWSEDRIARKVLPTQMLFERWQENDVGLWLVVRGAKIEYDDDLLLNMMAVMAAHERSSNVRRMRTGALRKGPLAGNGHLHHTPHGFVRDELNHVQQTSDPKIWGAILRMFELADIGSQDGGVGLSAPEIARRMAEEGYEIDHDRVLTILRDPIYATGEWTVNLGAIAVPQRPIPLTNPVPIDRFQRVQDWIALRAGGNENTPLGEYLFNYTESIHLQCEHERTRENRRVRVSGYNLPHYKDKTPKLRHWPTTPACCKGRGRGKAGSWDWYRDTLEPPVVAELRRLITHPDILRELVEAERHSVAASSARLTESERAELERQLDALVQQRQAAADTWVESQDPEKDPDFADFQRLDGSYTKRIRTLERRLENDRAMAETEQAGAATAGSDYTGRLDAFLEILTVETPTDARMKALRARLFSLIVSRLVIDDEGDGPITITIEGPLVPPGSAGEIGNPVLVAQNFLDRYIRETNGLKDKDEARIAQTLAVKSDLECGHSKSVSTIVLQLGKLPTVSEWHSLRRDSLANPTWNLRRRRRDGEGVPAWRATLTVDRDPASVVARLPELQRSVLDRLAPGVIASVAQLADVITADPSSLDHAVRALVRRGFVRRAVVGGIRGVAAIVCLSDDYSARCLVGVAARDLPLRAHEVNKVDGSVGAVALKARRQRDDRRKQLLGLARSCSLCAENTRALTALGAERLIALITAKELTAVVMPDGEVRFPSWQFDTSGQLRSEVAAVLRAADKWRIRPWTLHTLMIERSGPSGRSFADEFVACKTPSIPGDLLSCVLVAIEDCRRELERRRYGG